MTAKTEYYTRMAEEAARQVTGSREQWTSFLTTAARLYKYPYLESGECAHSLYSAGIV